MSDFERIRKTNRLHKYDYSQSGWYYVTICTKNKEDFFGEIVDGKMVLNSVGNIVKHCWFDLINHYLNIELDEFIIVPDHIHGILVIRNAHVNCVGTGLKPVPTNKTGHGLSEIIRGFKTFSSMKIHYELHINSFSWQRSFYDRIIRNEHEYLAIRQYIRDNPKNWGKDEDNLDV